MSIPKEAYFAQLRYVQTLQKLNFELLTWILENCKDKIDPKATTLMTPELERLSKEMNAAREVARSTLPGRVSH